MEEWGESTGGRGDGEGKTGKEAVSKFTYSPGVSGHTGTNVWTLSLFALKKQHRDREQNNYKLKTATKLHQTMKRIIYTMMQFQVLGIQVDLIYWWNDSDYNTAHTDWMALGSLLKVFWGDNFISLLQHVDKQLSIAGFIPHWTAPKSKLNSTAEQGESTDT